MPLYIVMPCAGLPEQVHLLLVGLLLARPRFLLPQMRMPQSENRAFSFISKISSWMLHLVKKGEHELLHARAAFKDFISCRLSWVMSL